MRKLWGISAAAAVLVGFACDDFEASDPVGAPDAAIDSDGVIDSGPPLEVDAAEAPDSGNVALTDATVAAPVEASTQKCTEKPFPGPVSVLTGARGFTLSLDEKTAYFSRGGKLWRAAWSFDPPYLTSQTALTADVHDPPYGSIGVVTLTSDETVLFNEDFFAVWRQQRVAGGFGARQEVKPAGLPSGRLVANPFLDRTTNELYMSVLKQNDIFTPPFGIVRTTLRADGTWSTPFDVVDIEPVAGEDPDDSIQAPVLTADGRTLYYGSMKNSTAPSDAGQNTDIWVATRSSTVVRGFSNPKRLDTLSNPKTGDAPSYVSRDGCTLFFRSSRSAPASEPNRLDIFMSKRAP